MGIINIINEMLNKNDIYSPIAEYVLQHLDDIDMLSTRIILKETNVSRSTLNRFFAKVNCNGFHDFKSQLIRDIEKNKPLNQIVGENT